MELGKSFYSEEEVKNLDTKEIIEIFIKLADILERLHLEGISHRDIKPDNLLYYKNEPVFGDFGLVDYPEAKNITADKEKIGAYFYMAPEFRRASKESCGEKGDIYSFGKTLWAVLTADYTAFDGQYNPEVKGENLNSYRNEELLGVLHELIEESTSYSPKLRPSMTNVKEKLKTFLDSSEFKKQKYEWDYLQKKLFNCQAPVTSCWEDSETIINILNKFSSFNNFNHTFFNSGGLDLKEAKPSNENGFIELYFSLEEVCKCKPKRLYLETFKESQWNYLYLELEDFEVNSLSKNYPFSSIEVWEDEPGVYYDRVHEFYGRRMDLPQKPLLNSSGRLVYILKGETLLICNKKGPYNHITSTYNGYQNHFDSIKFRKCILEMIKSGKIPKAFIDVDIKLKENSRELIKRSQKTSIIKATEKEILEVASQLNFNFKNNSEDSDLKYSLKIKFENFSIDINFRGEIKVNSVKKEFSTDDLCFLALEYIETNFSKGQTCIFSLNRINVFHNELIKELEKKEVKEIPTFEIDIKRLKKPTYLFDKEDIKNILSKGDHRKNNQIVITSNGTIKLIKRNSQEFCDQLYPVYLDYHLQPWENTVGKYTDLSDERIQNIYIELLNYWLEHLQKNEKVKYVDWFKTEDIKILLNEINSYY